MLGPRVTLAPGLTPTEPQAGGDGAKHRGRFPDSRVGLDQGGTGTGKSKGVTRALFSTTRHTTQLSGLWRWVWKVSGRRVCGQWAKHNLVVKRTNLESV